MAPVSDVFFSPSFITRICALMLCCSVAGTSLSASKDLGGGWRDHGVAVPISNHRGTVATVDGQNRKVLLMWLMDFRGGYELLLIDVETGKSEEFPLPFNNSKLDSPYASILSSKNKFYTHFGDYFVEFDPAKRAYTFSAKATPQMSMGMTEDDKGVIWSVAYPQSAVVSFNPETREFRDYGNVYVQNWPQYQRYVAADDAGWIYFALGQTASQIVALDPNTSKAIPLLAENERAQGTAHVYRDMDGKVYGQAHSGDQHPWLELYKGQARKIDAKPPNNPKKIITSSQALKHTIFPDGTTADANLVTRKLVVTDTTSKTKELSFDYKSEGAVIMALALASDNTLCGGTAFPMHFFSLDPKKDEIANRPAHGQWNTVTTHGNLFFAGSYPGGYLLQWDPQKPWVPTSAANPQSNPGIIAHLSPIIYRPHEVLATQNMVVLAGTPDYGWTGGGLLLWDRQTSSQVVLKEADIIPNQSTHAIVPVAGGKLLGGTTTTPGTGGEKKASQAELYILDPATKTIEWHEPMFPGAQVYVDMYAASENLVYGFADRQTFFVFDPIKRDVVYKKNVGDQFGQTVMQQGPRVFVKGPDGQVFVLFENSIGLVDPKTYDIKLVAKNPAGAECGGDYYDGRIYLGKGSHIYSFQLDQAKSSK